MSQHVSTFNILCTYTALAYTHLHVLDFGITRARTVMKISKHLAGVSHSVMHTSHMIPNPNNIYSFDPAAVSSDELIPISYTLDFAYVSEMRICLAIPMLQLPSSVPSTRLRGHHIRILGVFVQQTYNVVNLRPVVQCCVFRLNIKVRSRIIHHKTSIEEHYPCFVDRFLQYFNFQADSMGM